MNLDVTGVSDRQEKAHRNRERSSVCNPSPTRCLCLLGKQIMWCGFFLIKIVCGSFSASIMTKIKWKIHGWFMSMYDKNHYNIVISLQLIKINGKKKKKIPKLKFWKANQKGIAVLWNECEMNRSLSSGLKLILPLWQYIFPGGLIFRQWSVMILRKPHSWACSPCSI